MKKKNILSTIIILTFLLTACKSKEVEELNTIKEEVIDTSIIESEIIDDIKEETEVSEITETEEVEIIPEPTVIDIMMIGDILAHSPVYKSGKQEDGSYNFDHLFANILDEINGSDIKIVNQETILGGTELGLSSYPCFNSPQEIGDAEVLAGFNTILHATNHTLDKGLKGVNNTFDFWKNLYPDITVLGINENEDEYNNISIYQEDDFKVAILNYTYGTNGIPIPKSNPYIVNILDEEKIRRDVEVAHELADMVIICPHWGTEYVYKPDNMQKKYTKLFYELGVDVVIGTHPHVLEPVEVISYEDNDHEMLVYYSLGNFISSQDKKPRMVGGLAKVKLIKDYENNTCYIKEYELLPVVTQQGEYTSYLLEDYSEELAKQNRIKRYSSCSDFSFDYVNNLCESILGEDYNKEEYSLKKVLK